MDVNYINQIVHRAAMIATQSALNGHPLAGIAWIPPQNGSNDPMGVFVTRPHHDSASITPPWVG